MRKPSTKSKEGFSAKKLFGNSKKPSEKPAKQKAAPLPPVPAEAPASAPAMGMGPQLAKLMSGGGY